MDGVKHGGEMKPAVASRILPGLAGAALIVALAIPVFARTTLQKKQIARTQFETADRMRESLNGTPAADRTRRDYQRVVDAYRRVYMTAPTSSKADSSVVAAAELLAEIGRRFEDDKASRAAVAEYEFLRREYPGSKYRVDALFTIAQIYKQDLNDRAQAIATFEDFLKRYPHSHLAEDAHDAIAELQHPPADKPKKQSKETRPAKEPPADDSEVRAVSEMRHGKLPLVTGIRHWSTPDYTRVAIDLEAEVKYEAGRIPNPDRIFFDLHDTKLASVLVGKSFEVEDGFLHKVRVAQYEHGITRVVLDVSDVSDYSAFLLPDPYRLIIDIHGRQAARQTLMAKAAPPKLETPKPAETNTAAAKPEPAKPAPPPETAKSPAIKPVKTETVVAQKPTKADATQKPAAIPTAPEPERKSETAKLTPAKDDKPAEIKAAKADQPELKATAKPTSEPTFMAVAPRQEDAKNTKAAVSKKDTVPVSREAQPTASGDRSLIRALGLKIGKIVVDAGHGGHDTGTIGPHGLQEKDLTLDVALRLGKLLERMGADVVYTRDDDTFIPLETRTAIANQNQADLFISIHANSSDDRSARGVETYYLNFTSSKDALEVAARENAVSETSIHELQDLVKKIALKEKIEESREFATDVEQCLHTGLATKNPGIRDRGVKKAPFIVLIGANMPSILAEISFVSNPTDEKKLQTPEYRQKIAESLYRGITKYVNGLSGIKMAASVPKAAGN